MISNYDIHFDEHLIDDDNEEYELSKADEYCDELGLEF